MAGGALEDSFLVAGVAFKKTFSYAGFEMQPKNYKNCKIALLNIELELKAERDNAEVSVSVSFALTLFLYSQRSHPTEGTEVWVFLINENSLS